MFPLIMSSVTDSACSNKCGTLNTDDYVGEYSVFVAPMGWARNCRLTEKALKLPPVSTVSSIVVS